MVTCPQFKSRSQCLIHTTQREIKLSFSDFSLPSHRVWLASFSKPMCLRMYFGIMTASSTEENHYLVSKFGIWESVLWMCLQTITQVWSCIPCAFSQETATKQKGNPRPTLYLFLQEGPFILKCCTWQIFHIRYSQCQEQQKNVQHRMTEVPTFHM